LGTTANQKKVFFNLRKAQSKISILDEGDMRLDSHHAQQTRAAHLRNASARRCSNQSNAISRWDDEGGASSAGDRSVRIHSSGIEQPVKGAVAPTHIEDCQSNSDVPGKGRFAVRGGVLRKKGR